MSHKHAHLMRSIFQDPPSANIHWREIESLLHHLGADGESAHGARFKITLNKVEVPVADYAKLKKFFTDLARADRSSVLLKPKA